MSLFKTNLNRTTGKAVLSAALLSALLLTSCASTTPSDSNNTAAASSSATAEAPRGIKNFASAYFDVEKQVAINVSEESANIYLGNGVVVQELEADKSTNITLIPYEDKDKSWSTKVDFTPKDRNLMRWQGKSYMVVSGSASTTVPASGLTAEKTTTIEHVLVLDTETGKVVTTFAEEGLSLEVPNRYDMSAADKTKEDFRFMTGLVFSLGMGKGSKLVNPLTKQTIATSTTNSDFEYHNEAGYFSLRDITKVSNPYGDSILMRVIGNYALVSIPGADFTAKDGKAIGAKTYQLIDTITKDVVAEYLVPTEYTLFPKMYNSPDWRYLAFDGFVFDTKTGKSFNNRPIDIDASVRFTNLMNLDNDGNMYLSADSDLLSVNFADTSKVKTVIAKKENATSRSPIFFTDKGSAVFYSDDSKDILVTIPVK